MIYLTHSLLNKLAAFSGDDSRCVTAYSGLILDGASLIAGNESSFCKIKCLNAVNYGKLQIVPNYVIQATLISTRANDKIFVAEKYILIPEMGMRIEYEPVKLATPDLSAIFACPIAMPPNRIPFSDSVHETLRHFGLFKECVRYGLSLDKQYLRITSRFDEYQIDFAFKRNNDDLQVER